MSIKILNLKSTIILALFVIALVSSRLYNLDKTARFIWDESSDLVNIHQIYVERKLTLIGPISEDGSKVFGSLTYYMLLPFAILGKFDPVSTAYGAAFWGILTSILICYLTYKVNKKALPFVLPIVILWYPLVETGRWAWNPNLIPFWVTLSLILFLKKGYLFRFLSGLSIGLSIHLHYLAVFVSASLAVVLLTESIKKKNIKEFLAYLAGLALTILPFVIFDLTHPPGLFLSRILYFNNLGSTASGTTFIQNIALVVNGTFQYFTQSLILKILLIITLTLLLAIDLRKRSSSLRFAFVFLIQIVGLAFVANFYTHYIVPAIPFFILYLIFPRKGVSKILTYTTLIVLIISGVFSFQKQITKVTWEGDIASTRFIVDAIDSKIVKDNMKNVNVAVLSSPDPNTYGRRYRDLLLIKGVNLKTKGEYEISDGLFVITTQTLENVRKDPAYEIKFFKNGPLVEEWNVSQSNWKIFLLSKPT
ncbi:MAG: hypothetical protein NTZ07_04285 [Candidatus Woesebacteria bacterium]|nr:hypothetical protein [Candidatus Woesebacteria bacterium]